MCLHLLKSIKSEMKKKDPRGLERLFFFFPKGCLDVVSLLQLIRTPRGQAEMIWKQKET